VMAFILGGAMNVVAFFFSDRIAIASMRGEQVDASSAPALVAMVERLAARAGIPCPRIYVCPQEAPNAFATGRSPRHAAVAVTRGAMELLDERELEGVMAHELAHVKNRDTLISTVAATIAGALSALGWIFFLFGGGRDRGHPLVMLALVILAPIAAAMIQMAISRSREYVADGDAASIAGSPAGLVSALRKLDRWNQRIPLHNGQLDAANHLFIVKPMSMEGFAKLFATHPPIEDRIARLEAAG